MVEPLKLILDLDLSSTTKSLEINFSFLFDHAVTIARVGDIDQLMKKILNSDLVNNYYMSRPSSSWTMAGLPNIQLSIFYLQRTLIG